MVWRSAVRDVQVAGKALIRKPTTLEEGLDVAALQALAHELRTPLGAIVTLADMLCDATPEQLLDAQYQQYIRDIRESAVHGLAIVASALEPADPDANAQTTVGRITLSEIDLGNVVTQIARSLQPLAQSRGIVLKVDVDVPELVVTADARCVRQILFNLITNALRFTPASGTVSARVLQLGRHTPAIAVSDTGVGFGQPEPTMETGNDRWQAMPGGAAIGLKIAKALAAATGAQLTISSASGQGTTAVLSFPTVGSPEQDQTSAGVK